MPETRADGFISLIGGAHSGVDPLTLGDTYYARGINVSSRGALIHNRPGFIPTGYSLGTNIFQGASVWRLNSCDRFVYVMAGHLYSMIVDTGVTIDHGLLFDTSAQCYYTQADRYMLIQDGTSSARVLEEVAGTAQLRATTSMPPGYVMIFTNGRLHMVPKNMPGTTETGRPYLLSGDIAQPDDSSECLNFTESEYLSGGGAHSLPMEMGYIYGLGVLRNAATGTGFGGTVVLAKHGVSAFDFSVPRSLWQDQQLSQVLFFGPGTVSPWSVISLNDDLVYRGADGLRILRYTSSQVAGGNALSNTPQSNEVSVYFDGEPPAYLPRVSSATCDNRLYMTVGGIDAVYFKALVVLDLAKIGGLTGAQAPAYDGIWQLPDAHIAQVLSARQNGAEKIFVFTSTPDIRVLEPGAIKDDTTPIHSRVVTRVFNFTELVSLKTLSKVEMWISDLWHDVTIVVYARPMGYPLWVPMGTKTVKITAGTYPQRRKRLAFTLDNPGQYCDTSLGKLLNGAEAWQFAIDWIGHMTIQSFRAIVDVDEDAPVDPCSETDNTPIATDGTAGIALGEYL